MWDPVKSAKAYPKREDFVRDCVPILRREVELLRDEGVSIIQVDDPHLCLFVDPDVRSNTTTPNRPPTSPSIWTTRSSTASPGVKLAVHLCRRAGARARGEADHRGGYDPILKQLGRLKVGHITMEFTSPGAGDMSVFKQLPEHVEIGLGCVSCQPGQIDSADTIVSRVEMALQHLAPERITLNPDCGFAPGSRRRREPRRGLHEAQKRSRSGQAAAGEARLSCGRNGRKRLHGRVGHKARYLTRTPTSPLGQTSRRS